MLGGEVLKFIFPQNYNLKSKIFGFIDYSSAIFDVVWGATVFGIVNILFSSMNVKIFLFIILVLPVVIFSIVGINGENILYYMSYIFKYIFSQKLLLYEKEIVAKRRKKLYNANIKM